MIAPRSGICVGTCAVITVLAAASGAGGTASRQSAIAYLREPTLIGSTLVQGPVLFTHDDARSARGEACATVYLVEPTGGPLEEIASFHCIPTLRNVVHRFTVRTRPNASLGFGCVLTEFQFAGDAEAHGVPDQAPALASAESSAQAGQAPR